MRRLALVLTVLLATAAARAETVIEPADNAQKILPIHEILKRMESSPVTYKISSSKAAHVAPEDFAKLMWPPPPPKVDRPWVQTDATGKRTLTHYVVSESIRAQMDKAEKLYEHEEYEKAAALYEEILKIDPNCYIAHLYLGDCAYGLHDPARALKHYDRAAVLNPSDYQTQFFRGDALFQQGRYHEAIEAYTDALVDRPNHRPLIELLLKKSRQLGATVHDDAFEPQGMARRSGKAIDVILSDDASGNAAWMAYASCKAFWLGESSHRQELGVKPGVWSSVEERECLINLGAVYESAREKQSVKREEALDRLVKAGKEGLLDAFVIYEIASRMDPFITLTMSDTERAHVREYVKRFVLVPWEDERASAEE